jgi:CheY-like chemotaxis protein
MNHAPAILVHFQDPRVPAGRVPAGPPYWEQHRAQDSHPGRGRRADGAGAGGEPARRAADVEVVGECADGEEAVAAIERLSPELVFLDVQIPGLDGFGVIRAVTPQRMPMVVFTTAYDEYALRAFEVHALDYLLKPFDAQRFRHARRARTRAARAPAHRRPRAAPARDGAGRAARGRRRPSASSSARAGASTSSGWTTSTGWTRRATTCACT